MINLPAPEGVKQEHWDYAGEHADLGVGHVWTNTRCAAYRTFDPADCKCLTLTVNPATLST